MVKIAVADYGVGNLRSIRKAIEFSGTEVVTTNDSEILMSSDAIVLLSAGSFSGAMGSTK